MRILLTILILLISNFGFSKDKTDFIDEIKICGTLTTLNMENIADSLLKINSELGLGLISAINEDKDFKSLAREKFCHGKVRFKFNTTTMIEENNQYFADDSYTYYKQYLTVLRFYNGNTISSSGQTIDDYSLIGLVFSHVIGGDKERGDVINHYNFIKMISL